MVDFVRHGDHVTQKQIEEIILYNGVFLFLFFILNLLYKRFGTKIEGNTNN